MLGLLEPIFIISTSDVQVSPDRKTSSQEAWYIISLITPDSRWSSNLFAPSTSSVPGLQVLCRCYFLHWHAATSCWLICEMHKWVNLTNILSEPMQCAKDHLNRPMQIQTANCSVKHFQIDLIGFLIFYTEKWWGEIHHPNSTEETNIISLT